MKSENEKILAARNYVQEQHPQLPVPEKSYFIMMIPRTGSNLLASHLENIGFGHPIEAFHFNQRRMEKTYQWNIDFSDPVAHLRKAIEFQTVDGIFGMKLNWQQLDTFLRTTREITEPSGISLNDRELFEVFFPSAAFIYMKRLGKIKQAVSFSKGMQTGIWKERVGEDQTYKQYVMPPVYDRAHIEGCLEELLAYDVSWKNFLKNNGFQYLELWYEDLAQNYVDSIQKVYDHLGIGRSEIPEPALRKQANLKSQDWAARFSEETPWVNQKTVREALEHGDFLSAFIHRGTEIIHQKEQKRWHSMPSTRFKPVRWFFFRVKKKIDRDVWFAITRVISSIPIFTLPSQKSRI